MDRHLSPFQVKAKRLRFLPPMAKIKLIHCGVGGFGGVWIRNFCAGSPDFQVVALVDVSPNNLEEARAATGLPANRCFTTLEEAVRSVPAEAVLSVTPPPVHVRHARTAFRHGLHFLCEKPMASTLREAVEMVALARQARRQLVISQNYRFRAPIQKLAALARREPLGSIGYGTLEFFHAHDFTGSFRETMEYPLILDMAIHHFDLIRAVTGRNILRVLTKSFKPTWSWFRHDPAACVFMELEGGLPFVYHGDWTARGRTTDWNGTWRLQCAEGSITCDHGRIVLARSDRFSAKLRETEPNIPALARTEQKATLRLFAQAIRTGQENELCGSRNLWSYAAVEAAAASARTGRPVDVATLIRRATPRRKSS
jgi:predicted dehydrogenase